MHLAISAMKWRDRTASLILHLSVLKKLKHFLWQWKYRLMYYKYMPSGKEYSDRNFNVFGYLVTSQNLYLCSVWVKAVAHITIKSFSAKETSASRCHTAETHTCFFYQIAGTSGRIASMLVTVVKSTGQLLANFYSMWRLYQKQWQNDKQRNMKSLFLYQKIKNNAV